MGSSEHCTTHGVAASLLSQHIKKENKVMDGPKMVRIFLALTLAMSVASQPLDNIATSGAATLSTQVLNWAQVGFEAFLEWAKRGFGLCTDEEHTTTRPRILVVTGSSTKKTEVWPKPESQCALPDFPLEVFGAVGFWTAQGPMVCGGRGGGNKCFLYKNHQWMPSTTIGTSRVGASTIQITPNQAIIIGGYGRPYGALKTTKVISSTGSEEGKDFPVRIMYHCSFKINSTHALVTGGYQDESISASTRVSRISVSTWFVDLATTTFTPGPMMKTARSVHGCSTFHLGRKTFGIVAGGWGNSGKLDSTEWIDLEEDSPTWTEGPKLPRGLSGHTLVETTQGTYALGGYGGYDFRAEVLHLVCPVDQIQSCQWQEMPEKLEVGRKDHVSLSLPESYDICN